MFLSTEKGIFFHILSHIFAIECQIPVINGTKVLANLSLRIFAVLLNHHNFESEN